MTVPLPLKLSRVSDMNTQEALEASVTDSCKSFLLPKPAFLLFFHSGVITEEASLLMLKFSV